MKKTFSIGDTAKITGITQKQLRYWEKTKILNNIQRVVCGERAYRQYSYDQIKLINKIKKYLDIGYTLNASVRLAKESAGKEGRPLQTLP
jgi:DNA-binding transcriptional MerR regulator